MLPELKTHAEIKEVLDKEEDSFARTLDHGEKLFERYAQKLLQTQSKSLKGQDV